MPNLGFSELIVILMILLLVFGASRLPALGESVGRTIRSFKRGVSSDDEIAVRKQQDSSPPQAPGSGGKSESDVADAEVVERKP